MYGTVLKCFTVNGLFVSDVTSHTSCLVLLNMSQSFLYYDSERQTLPHPVVHACVLLCFERHTLLCTSTCLVSRVKYRHVSIHVAVKYRS